jgi:hypothetical protein
MTSKIVILLTLQNKAPIRFATFLSYTHVVCIEFLQLVEFFYDH